MKRLRVGLVGAGLVGQAEHAFYLWEERERFEFVALADASASVREALRERYGLQHVHADINGRVGLRSRCRGDRGARCLSSRSCGHRARRRPACAVREAAVLDARRLRPHRRGARSRRQGAAGRVHEAARSRLQARAGAAAREHRGREADLGGGQRSGLRALHRASADDLAQGHSRGPAQPGAVGNRGAAARVGRRRSQPR